ncbi:hypothetical protein HJG60_008975 [Phyllostomus discolor]|uniref:Uncharacterized protein n=1 Tax=Phyllostomus discolor TaxID=89673 RepID=A0A834DFH2_9CHIR|nr:hypothetical protein HJG60_008975 [Phyllostomus discolor]
MRETYCTYMLMSHYVPDNLYLKGTLMCLKIFNPSQIIDFTVLLQNFPESFCMFPTSLFSLLHPSNYSENPLSSALRAYPETDLCTQPGTTTLPCHRDDSTCLFNGLPALNQQPHRSLPTWKLKVN